MSELDVHARSQIEDALGRTLLPDDLTPVSSVDHLTPEQVAIVKILARNQLLAALLFMRAIVPDETSAILNEYIYGCSAPSSSAARSSPASSQPDIGPLPARFSFECSIYMSFHPCACGDTTPMNVKLEPRGAGVIAIYDGVCPVCEKARHFEFVISSDDEGRSAILDAGQWLIAAERSASAVPAQLDDLDEGGRLRARINLERAVIALNEALKFVPSGDDRVPAEALFSPDGRALYEGEPGRFRRVRIEAVLATYERPLRMAPLV